MDATLRSWYDRQTDNVPEADFELAVRIVEALRDASAPDACSWGEKYPEAHHALFGGKEGKSLRGGYFEDMVGTICEVLNNET